MLKLVNQPVNYVHESKTAALIYGQVLTTFEECCSTQMMSF